jgi:membrane associated rhomboid family serine protease
MLRRPKPPLLVPLIIAINVVVFFMWHFLPLPFMMRHFAVSWVALEEGRYWVLLTSVFSHSFLFHLLINMFVLYSFGRFLEQILGRQRFLTFYLVAGVIGSLSHAVLSNYYIHQPEQAAVGASGAIAGLILLFSLLFPKEKILLFGIIPVPALFGALGFIAFDLWGLVEQSQGGGLPIGHGAHLGGAATGVVFYFMLRSKRNL